MTATGFSWQELHTDAVAASDRLDYWCDATNNLFPPTRLSRASATGFYGQVSWLTIGELTVADIRSTKLDVIRTEREIGASDDRWFELTIQLDGECAFSHDGRDLVTAPRSMVLYDSRKPYRMRFDGPYRQISLKVPRDALRERVPTVDRLVAHELSADGLAGRFIFDFVAGLCLQPIEVPAALAGRLENHIVELMATALLGADVQAPLTASGLALIDRIKAHILSRLDDPDLAPRDIATAQNISLRRLYELFEAEGQQVARWIQCQRLDRIRRELADPLQRGLPINTIALSRGFKEFSHFSRAFRRQYGISPRDYRNGLLN